LGAGNRGNPCIQILPAGGLLGQGGTRDPRRGVGEGSQFFGGLGSSKIEKGTNPAGGAWVRRGQGGNGWKNWAVI